MNRPLRFALTFLVLIALQAGAQWLWGPILGLDLQALAQGIWGYWQGEEAIPLAHPWQSALGKHGVWMTLMLYLLAVGGLTYAILEGADRRKGIRHIDLSA